jgi:hypothetical protein
MTMADTIAERTRPAASALLRLAAQAADRADYARIAELFSAARGDLAASEARRWHGLLLEAGLLAEASEVAGIARITGEEAPPESEKTPGEEAGADFLDFEAGPRREPRPAPSQGLIAPFLKWFSGRADVHARQWHDARRDRSGYWPVREPLDARVVEQHLLGRITAGQYVLHPDDTAGFAVLDLDPTAEALAEAQLDDPAAGAFCQAPMRDHARRILLAGEALGLRLFLEDTGGAGLHVWLFFQPRIAASRARALLRELLWRAGPQPPALSIEMFPKQDRLSGKGLGNLVKLPLGIHQATLRRSRFLDREGVPLDDEAALAQLAASPPEAVEAAIARRVVSLDTARPGAEPRSEPPLRLPAGPSPRPLAEALAAIAPARAAEAASDRILAGCAVLRELARRAHEGPPLSADDARFLLYTVGLAGRENDRIDSLFAAAGVSRKEVERARQGLQSPLGCKKLRERHPAIAAHCVCPEPAAGGYATPALFAFRKNPSASRNAVAAPEIDRFAAEVPGDVQSDIERRLERIEAALGELLAKRRQE